MAKPVVVTIEGWRDVDRALRKVDRDKSAAFREEFAKAGEHVAEAFQRKIVRYAGARMDTVRSKALAKGVFVVQNANKVTGKRGDFGALQMRHLIAAREENIDKTIDALEDAMDRVIARAGF